MARTIEKLSAISIRKLSKGYHGDGAGLWLQVTEAGTRSWVFRYTYNGARREMGLGPTHTITLAQAREAAQNARQKIAEGIDPIEHRMSVRLETKQTQTKIKFEDCCEKFIEAHRAGWKNAKHANQWKSTLKTYCSDFMRTPVENVQRTDIHLCLEKIWVEKNETATRLRGRIEAVLDWATVHGYRQGDNPARWGGNLDYLLPSISKSKRVKHHPALPWRQIGTFMEQLRTQVGIAPRALEFLILTACRSGEVRGARWDEFNFEDLIWTIPSSRMKAEREHRVPLSKKAVSLLRSLPRFGRNCLVFPSSQTEKILSDMALNAVLKRMKIEVVPHGFRSTFRDWAGEITSYPREVCEHALAHKLADGVEAAYQRGDMLQKRILMMEDWAEYCSKP